MVERLATSMSKYGIGVDVLCMDHLRIVNNTKQNYKFVTKLLFRYFSKHQSGYAFRIVRKFFSPMLLRSLIKQYDLIDFHVFALEYIPYMRFCVMKRIPFDITLWGSDVVWANENAVKRKRYGFEYCRYIKATDNLLEVVNKTFPSLFASKFKSVCFGNSDFETIDLVSSLYKTDINKIREEFIPEAKGKIIVTCGYNGSKRQNHFRILEAIGHLSPNTLERIYLILPFTYGATEEYLLDVDKALKELEVSYTLYSNRLSIDDIAKIRLVSDVVVNMQDTDGFSGSLQDHLYCKNVLIVGEWLNYVLLDDAGVYYIRTSYDSLTENITKVLTGLTSYKQQCEDNYIKMMQLTSWKCVLPRWAESYKS